MLETMSSKLVAEEGLLKDLVLSFEDGDQWVIGRDPDACQLLIEDPTVSRKHLLCTRSSQGITINNLSTTNPVYVNDVPLSEPRLLENGDLVKLGESVFRFYLEEGAHLYEETSTRDEELEPLVETSEDSILETDEPKSDRFPQINFDLMDTGRWLLKVVGGPNNGAEFSMHAGNSYTLGTDPNACDVVLYDTSVSRQHVRITVNEDDTLTIEDLKSRNGTRIDGELIQDKVPLQPNVLVVIGTSTLVIYDREGEMQTVISPLLPSIVKVLQKEEPETEPEKTSEEELPVVPTVEAPSDTEPKQRSHTVTLFIMALVLLSLFAIAGIGTRALFMQEEVVKHELLNPNQQLQDALKPFAGLKFTFNPSNGRLLLLGHVMTATDKSQLLYNLQGLTFINDIDDSGVIIDEYVWNEINQVISRNPSWRGVSVHAPSAGHFILSGYLKTRKEAEMLWDYMTRNFSYIDLLENKIIIEEDIVSNITALLFDKGLSNVKVDMEAGDVTFSGTLTRGKMPVFLQSLDQIRKIPAVRFIKSSVAEIAQTESLINISDQYSVSGTSRLEGGKLSVIVNGRILEVGDVLDGMQVTKIQPHMILLEKDGVMYRIDFKK